MRYAPILFFASLFSSVISAYASQVQCVDLVGTVVVRADDDEHLPITNLVKVVHDKMGTVARMNEGKACFARQNGDDFSFTSPKKTTINGTKYIKYKTIVKWVPSDGNNIIVFIHGDLNGRTYGYCGPARNGFVATGDAKTCW